MEIKNFIINILIGEDILNNVLFNKSDLDAMPLNSRTELFNAVFFNISNETVRSLTGVGRRYCSTWDNVVFNVSSDDALIGSSNFTRTAVESDLTSVPQTMGEFIETQYQALIIS